MSVDTTTVEDTKKSLPEELVAFREQVKDFEEGRIGQEQFKAARVNLGIYAQRQEGYYMVRTKIPAGRLRAEAFGALADIADRYADGHVHITTRQDFQFYFVTLDKLAPILEALHREGITTSGAGGNTVRNVIVCDHPVEDPGKAYDLTGIASAVSSFFTGKGISKGLPRKFKITFAGCGEDCGWALSDDIGAMAVRREEDGAPGFRLFAGGGQGAVPRFGRLLDEFVPAERVHVHILAALNAFNRHGLRANRNRARLKFLIENVGMEKFREFYTEELSKLSDIEPLSIRPLELLSATRPTRRFSIQLKAPVGDFTSAQLRAVGSFLFEHKQAEASNTTSGSILISGLDESSVDNAKDRLKTLGLDPRDDGPGHVVRSCYGASTCNEGITNSKALGRLIEPILENRKVNGLGPVSVSISGCPNSCARHHTANIGLQGSAKKVNGRLVPHYLVYLGGSASGPEPRLGEPVVRIPARRAPSAVERLLEIFAAERKGGEDASATFTRLGRKWFEKELQPFTTLPPYEEDREAYLDWEAEREFSLDEVGPGECAGAALDIIDGYFNLAREDLDEAREALLADDRETALKSAHLSAVQSAKALLVTYGIEPATEEETFREFRNKLITRGFVSERYNEALVPLDEKIRRGGAPLGEMVELHVRFMEECLAAYSRINAKANVEEAPAEEVKLERMDLSGVKCPFNYIKIKLKLETAPPGTRLEAILDPGSPIRNVPQSLKNDGHKILSIEEKPNGQYLITVEKT